MTDPIEKHGAAQADADSHLKSLVEYGAILIGTQSDSSTPQPKGEPKSCFETRFVAYICS